jgi:hypothetical protein
MIRAVELWLNSNLTGEWVSMDIADDLTISITKSFEEITDFTQRLSSYSKTFTIPQSATNNKFFQAAYMVNSSGFVDSVVVPAVIKYGGADVFVGDCRLNAIITTPEAPIYEIFLTQSLPDFANILQDFRIIDLDFQDAFHTLSYDNVVSTWQFTGGSYNDYNGIVGKIVYPMANYGYVDTLYHGIFDNTISGFTNSSFPLTLQQFAPWVSVKYLVDKIFERAGFTYTSDFFDSDYFAGIFALAKTNNTMGVKISEDATENQNIFLAQARGGASNGGFFDTNFSNTGVSYTEQFFLGNEVNDPLNIFTPSLTISNRTHFFTAAVTGVYRLKFSFAAFQLNSSFPLYLNVALKDLDNGTIYSSVEGLLIFGTTELTNYSDIYFTSTIPAGRRVGMFYSRQDVGGPTRNSATLGIFDANLELYSSPLLQGTDSVLLQDNLPSEITALDYFRGIVSLFNLVVIPQGDRNLFISRWDDYFTAGRVLDYSQKIDMASEIALLPTNELQREYILQYAGSEDRFSSINQQDRNQQFGTYRFLSSVPYHTGTIVVEVPFQPLPIATFDVVTPSNVLIPHLYQWNRGGDSLGNEYNPIGSLLRLGFYNGLMDFTITGTTTSWYLLSGATSIAHQTYPAISHLSAYEYSASTFSDLNFGNQYDFWQVPQDTYVGFTDRDVWNDFWSGRVLPLYDTDVKLLRASFLLTPEDIKDLQFNDRAYFLDAYWRLISMVDADITQKTLVSCEWVKLPFTQEAQPLISPTYEQAEFEPIPTPSGSTYASAVFTGNSITNLCAEIGTQGVVFSNCSQIVEGCSVFSNTSATIPIAEGSFLKVPSAPTIYQVIENGLLTDFTIC